MKNIILMILGFFLLTSFVSADVGNGFCGQMMGNALGTGMWGIGIFGWLFMILIIIALILLIIWLIKQVQKK